MIYTENYKVRYSETGDTLKASLSSIMAYLQDTSICHSENAGIGVKKLSEQNLAWILAGWHVKINRFPVVSENITTKTWASGFKNMYGYRNFNITDENEDIIAKASSVWVLYNYKDLKFEKVTSDDIERYGVEDIPVFADDTVYKVKKAAVYEKKSDILVQKTDIDTNGHVNNIKYIAYIVNAFPELKFTEFRIQYKSQAKLGDTIEIYYNCNEEERSIMLSSPDGVVFALAEIID